jgi:RNA polymerase sigma-70 factor (ECF subfamily)
LAVESTSLSLLQRLHRADDQDAWRRFVDLYTPLLLTCGRRLGLSADDAADLVQDVLVILVRQLPHFIHDGKHSFRAWLKTVVRNCYLNQRPRRPAVPLEAVPEAAVADGAADVIEQDYLHSVSKRALKLMQTDFEPTTWRACWETVVEGRTAAEVAAELGLSVGAVYVARSRVLARLRRELQGLME